MSLNYEAVVKRLVPAVCRHGLMNKEFQRLCIESLVLLGVPREHAEKLASGSMVEVPSGLSSILREFCVVCNSGTKYYARIAEEYMEGVSGENADLKMMLRLARHAFINNSGMYPVSAPTKTRCWLGDIEFFITNDAAMALSSLLATMDTVAGIRDVVESVAAAPLSTSSQPVRHVEHVLVQVLTPLELYPAWVLASVESLTGRHAVLTGLPVVVERVAEVYGRITDKVSPPKTDPVRLASIISKHTKFIARIREAARWTGLLVVGFNNMIVVSVFPMNVEEQSAKLRQVDQKTIIKAAKKHLESVR